MYSYSTVNNKKLLEYINQNLTKQRFAHKKINTNCALRLFK